MTTNKLISVIIIWCLLTVYDYYFVSYFILALIWIALSLTLFIASVIQIIKLLKDRNRNLKLRIINVLVFVSLFFLTLYSSMTNSLIEHFDFKIFYNKRTKIVGQVKARELRPNVSWNNWICKLPFEFPVVSNGGNDIGIIEHNSKTTVSFWTFRNFFDGPSTSFIYTDDPDKIKSIQELIRKNPKQNWKIQDNWYRTYDE